MTVHTHDSSRFLWPPHQVCQIVCYVDPKELCQKWLCQSPSWPSCYGPVRKWSKWWCSMTNLKIYGLGHLIALTYSQTLSQGFYSKNFLPILGIIVVLLYARCLKIIRNVSWVSRKNHSLRWKSVTRRVNSNWTKIGGKCQNWKWWDVLVNFQTMWYVG